MEMHTKQPKVGCMAANESVHWTLQRIKTTIDNSAENSGA